MKFPPIVLVLLLLSGCQSAYYGAMEQVGIHKRDIMVDRVEDAKEAQIDAQKEFTSALEELSTLISHDGGDLEAAYNKTRDEYESAQDAADLVSKRINKVEGVAEALFDEWEDELTQITKASYRQSSANKLKETKRNYSRLMKSMRKAESKMVPVLTALKDNMLFLKHNLNAHAIGAIEGEFDSLKLDIGSLLKEMNASIEESNRFIAKLEK